MAQASIVGAGMTKFGTHADVTLAELFAEAALPALDDAEVGLLLVRAGKRGAVRGGCPGPPNRISLTGFILLAAVYVSAWRTI
jgi:acetyl-CoA acetyltransferase